MVKIKGRFPIKPLLRDLRVSNRNTKTVISYADPDQKPEDTIESKNNQVVFNFNVLFLFFSEFEFESLTKFKLNLITNSSLIINNYFLRVGYVKFWNDAINLLDIFRIKDSYEYLWAKESTVFIEQYKTSSTENFFIKLKDSQNNVFGNSNALKYKNRVTVEFSSYAMGYFLDNSSTSGTKEGFVINENIFYFLNDSLNRTSKLSVSASPTTAQLTNVINISSVTLDNNELKYINPTLYSLL